MPKVSFTKGELKRQRDTLKQYQRYLPTLQLKKQQLQIEILRQTAVLEKKDTLAKENRDEIETWAGLLSDQGVDMKPWITPKELIVGSRSVAGVELPVFDRAEFDYASYDLFITPLWVDAGIEALRELASKLREIDIIKEGIRILRHELRITTQRLNLFEKVKIPEAQEAIRAIRIYLGDQMANAVGRSKIAKRKIETAVLEGSAV